MKPVPHDVFLAQCKRRFGVSNPERIHSEHWEWMVRSKRWARLARSELGGDPYASLHQRPWRPEWCFDRFGMSRTRMADGRIICIGGEHEDGYDPDFCIFNDVVVLFPADGKDDVDLESGRVEIYGYPESIFPPTDFHSATIVEDQIYIIGSLGYGDDRDDDSCQLYVLDSNNYRINSLEHSGPHPGWISRHHASYDPAAHAITVRGGKRIVADDYRANHCIHRLHLEVMRWEQVAEFERHYFYQFGTVAEAWVRSIQDFCPPASAKMLWTDMPEVFVKSFDMMDIRCTLKNLCGSVRLVIEGDPGDEARADLIASVQDFLAAESGAEWYANEVASFD